MGFPNPFGWIGSELSAGTKQLLSWLTDAVNYVEGEVGQLWNNTVTWVNGVYSWTGREINSAYSTVNRWINDVYTYVGKEADAIYRWAGNEVNGLISDINGVYNTVNGWVNQAISFAASLPYHVEQWVISNIWNPILGFFTTVYRDVEGWINDVYKWVVANVWNPIVGLYHDIIKWATDAVNWVESFGEWAWGLLKGAEHWLVWAAHVDWDVAVAMWNYVAHPNFKRIVADTESGLTDLGQGMEDVLSAWLDQ